MSRTSVPLLALVLATFVVGCEGQNLFTGSAAGVDVVGTYFLDTIDGEELPVVIVESGSEMIEITRGVLDVNRDRTFLYRATLRITTGSQVQTRVETSEGTYEVEGDTMFYLTTEGVPGEVLISGNALVEMVDGREFIYRR